MAKKRRRPHNRPQSSAAVRTTDRPDGRAAADEPAEGNGRARPGRSRTDERGPGAASRSRAEKKELARRQREEVRRRVRRAERTRRLAWIAGVGAVIALGVFLLVRPDEPIVRPERLPGEIRTEAPWGANGDEAPERADVMGLPAEGTTMHEHANVQVFVDGERQPIPVNAGINTTADPAELTSLHTHTDDGLVHVESQTVRRFTLGEFFDVWGVRLSGTCLGAYCEEGEDRLRAFVGGEEITGPIRDVPLDDQTVIVVAYGTDAELPDPIPSTFDFASIQP